MPKRLAAVAVDVEGGGRRLGLLVRGDVLELGQFLQLGHQPRGPAIELVEVVVRQGILELGAGRAAADVDVLVGLQHAERADHPGQLGPQAVDDLRGAGAAPVVARAQADVEEGLGRVAAKDIVELVHVRVGGDDLGHLLGLHVGMGVGRALGGDHGALDEAGVLLREEAGLGGGVKRAGHDQGGDEHRHGQALVRQDPVQAARVALLHPVKAPLQRPHDPGGRRFGRLEEAAAQHGRQGQGQDHGHDHRGAEHQGELLHHLADDPAHEHQGREHRDQGDGDRQDGEADLTGAVQGGLQGRLGPPRSGARSPRP